MCMICRNFDVVLLASLPEWCSHLRCGSTLSASPARAPTWYLADIDHLVFTCPVHISHFNVNSSLVLWSFDSCHGLSMVPRTGMFSMFISSANIIIAYLASTSLTSFL